MRACTRHLRHPSPLRLGIWISRCAGGLGAGCVMRAVSPREGLTPFLAGPLGWYWVQTSDDRCLILQDGESAKDLIAVGGYCYGLVYVWGRADAHYDRVVG